MEVVHYLERNRSNAGDQRMNDFLVWREMTFGHRGRALTGSYAISAGRVFVKTAFGEKSAPIDHLPTMRLAQQLMIELADGDSESLPG
jgi:hypothetical protein